MKFKSMENYTKKMKIMFVLPSLYHGGAERALITIMNKLDKSAYECEFLSFSSKGTLKNLIHPDIELHALGSSKPVLSLFRLVQKTRVIKPDIIFTTMAYSNFIVLALKFFFPHIHIIVREAVIPSSILKKYAWRAWIIKILYGILYPLADYVISPSQDIIDEFRDVLNLNLKNHVLVYNQIDESDMALRLDDIDFPGVQSGTLRLVCAGRLHAQKGYDRLIEALANFKPAHPWCLLILGDGSENLRLEALIRQHQLGEHIHLMGAVENPWRIIAAADCLLLPSRWEGMPNVVLEALACGTPVIASKDANGVAEIKAHAQDGDILIARNMDQFVDYIRALSPQHKDGVRPSRLPDCFQSARIMERFEALLRR